MLRISFAVSRQKRKEKLRSSSHERFLDDIDKMDPPLSKTSALNDRYFESKTRADMVVEDPYHTKSRPEPLGGGSAAPVLGLSKTSRLNERYAADQQQQRDVPGLSETSKLNKRYLMTNQKSPPDVQQRTVSSSPPAWQDELGLASSALNDRLDNILTTCLLIQLRHTSIQLLIS